jgi:hypothetical protein
LATQPPNTWNVNGFGSFNFKLNNGSGFFASTVELYVLFQHLRLVIERHTIACVERNGHRCRPRGARYKHRLQRISGQRRGSGSRQVDNSACVPAAVPEPSSAALLFIGVALMGGSLFLGRGGSRDSALEPSRSQKIRSWLNFTGLSNLSARQEPFSTALEHIENRQVISISSRVCKT